MTVIKNQKSNTYEVRTYYKDWTGVRKQKTKRGFKRKCDAQEWERAFKLKENLSLDMYFEDFVDLYLNDIKSRIKYNTWLTKKHIVEKKILPYFSKKKLQEIKPSDIRQWQNTMMNYRNKQGEGYSQVYLKTIHNQLSAILNHAVNFYDLKSNAARKAGSMGKERTKEMLFWTKEEYMKFIEAVADKPISFYAFEILYWCGVRMGELLALTPADFDFQACTIRINKSYQRLEGKDIITDPKTVKSNRMITMPEFLSEELESYIGMLYGLNENDRIFQISKSYLHHEMDRGVKLSGVKRIRIHDLRHSHVSLLINMGYSAVAIGERVGHESVEITYRYAHLFPTIQTENEELDLRVKLCGYQTRQEYIIESVLHQKVTAVGNPLMLVQFRKQLRGIEEELKRLTILEDADEELFTPIRTMLEILNAFAEERNYERRKKEKAQK